MKRSNFIKLLLSAPLALVGVKSVNKAIIDNIGSKGDIKIMNTIHSYREGDYRVVDIINPDGIRCRHSVTYTNPNDYIKPNESEEIKNLRKQWVKGMEGININCVDV